MSKLLTYPSASFDEPIAPHDLELRGVRARAFEFRGGVTSGRHAVVCVAGMGADGRSFARLKPLATTHHILPLNMPFDTPPGTDPLVFAADVVEEFLDAERLELPVLLGSSFGGAVAAVVALRRAERLGGLVLANAVLSHRQIPLAFPGFVDLLNGPEPLARLMAPIAAQIMGGMALDRDSRDEIVREARHFSVSELKRRLRSLIALELLPALKGLRLPALVVHGSRDLLVPWRRGRWSARALPHAHFELIRGAGHLPYLSHPRHFNTSLAQFLQKLSATDFTKVGATAG
jgi:pimeloyl-ACP methyl ester carboxylesterase